MRLDGYCYLTIIIPFHGQKFVTQASLFVVRYGGLSVSRRVSPVCLLFEYLGGAMVTACSSNLLLGDLRCRPDRHDNAKSEDGMDSS